MLFLKRLITGVLMGIATMVSVGGGTIAIIMKMYDELLDSVTLNLRKLSKKLPLLIPVCGGFLIGVFLAAVLVDRFLFVRFLVPTMMFFLGVVLGSIPVFYKEGTKTEKLRPLDIIPFLIGAGAILLMWFYEQSGGSDPASGMSALTIIRLILGGIVTAAAAVLPGLSASAMMMVLGVYALILSSISSPLHNIPVLIIFGISFVVGIFLSAKPISFLLKKHRKTTYCVIGGFVVGSLPSLFPYEDFRFDLQGFVGIALCAAGLFVPFLLEKIAADENGEQAEKQEEDCQGSL
jgi:putative membrane protein